MLRTVCAWVAVRQEVLFVVFDAQMRLEGL